jgi:phenylpropionate dioxygenase-like ring-hydroxylating dioxygenase large terminal subunit
LSDLLRALELFWHPVCSLAELEQATPHPMSVMLLGRRLAVADLGEGEVAAVADRCLHRSTRLSVGWIEQSTIRCAYHGWRWAGDGRCVEIPSMPDGPIPPRACIDAYETEIAYGLVWVRIDRSAATAIPPHPAWEDDSLRVLAGTPYTWPVGAPRRVENFVDLAHFAWVHDGTLGRRDQPVPPMADVRREDGELRFEYNPPDMEPDDRALYGWSRYRMPMPLSVDIEFRLATGARRHLWMTASPLDLASCRSFWSVSRDDDLDGDDESYLAFQDIILAQDEPVVCAQDPPELPLEAGVELSVRTDRVSIEYRRWLRQLATAAAIGPAAVTAALCCPSEAVPAPSPSAEPY